MLLTDDQKEARLSAITGSDVAVILGLSPWKTPVDLWGEKLRLAAPEDISQEKAVIRGNYLESAVASWWSDSTGKLTEIDTNFLQHKTYPWMRGNIDRRVTGERAILECKTASRSFGWDELSNTVPLYYLVQLAHYVAIDDAERGYMAVYITNSDEFLRFTYERNIKLEEKMIARCKDFWENNILKEIPPEPVNMRDVISLHGAQVQNSIVQVPSDDDGFIEQTIYELSKVKDNLSDLRKREKELQDVVAVYMNKNDMIIDSNQQVLATWKSTKPFQDFDEKRFKAEHAELYKSYCVTKVQRRMLIK